MYKSGQSLTVKSEKETDKAVGQSPGDRNNYFLKIEKKRVERQFFYFLQNLENYILPQLTPQDQTSSKWESLGICQLLKSKPNGPDDPVSCLFFIFVFQDDSFITGLISPVHSISFLIHLPTSESDSNPSHTQESMTPSLLAKSFKTKVRTALGCLLSHRSACYLRVATLGTDIPHLSGTD